MKHSLTGSAGTYRIVSEIGRGSYGVVHLAYLHHGNVYDCTEAALKCFPAKVLHQAREEAALLLEVAHPGVVKLIEIIAPTQEAELRAIIVMPAASTNLASFLLTGPVR